ATTKLGELAHAHDRRRGELAFPTAAGLGVVLVFHDAHSFLSGGVTRSQSKPRPTPAGTRPGKFATPFPIFPRFACLYCDLNDSQLRRPSYLHFAHEPIRLAPNEVDAQQAVAQVGRFDLDAVGQHEGPAELPRCDAATQVLARLILLLAAANHELIVLNRDLELVAPEARNCERNAQAVGSFRTRTVRAGAVGKDALDVVGGITVALADPVDQALHFFKAQQQWARQQRHP